MNAARILESPALQPSAILEAVKPAKVRQVPLSIIILTQNEEQDLPRCLQALAWCDDVHVVDSGSTDETVEVARAHGAKVSVNQFESFGRQRNWALDACCIQHPWVLFLDADEIATESFVREVECAIAEAPSDCAGFYCCWKLMFCGRWLRRCDSFPKWQFRLLRVGRARFTDFGHGQKEGAVDGTLGYISTPYEHHAFSKGLSHWVARHNHYSDREAVTRLKTAVDWKRIFSRHGSKRNQALKPLVSKLPGWPVLRFLWMYLVRLGVLEGRPGLIYCCGIAFYEFLIGAKIYELKSHGHAQNN